MPGKKQKIGMPRGVSNDSFRVAKSDGEVKLFAKFNHKWYSTALADAFSIRNKNQARKHSILTYNNGAGELNPSITAHPDGKLYLRNNKGTSKVLLKNDEGILKVRDSLDDNDVVLSAKRVKISDAGTASSSVLASVGDMGIDSSGIYQIHGSGIVMDAATTTNDVTFTTKCVTNGTSTVSVHADDSPSAKIAVGQRLKGTNIPVSGTMVTVKEITGGSAGAVTAFTIGRTGSNGTDVLVSATGSTDPNTLTFYTKTDQVIAALCSNGDSSYKYFNGSANYWYTGFDLSQSTVDGSADIDNVDFLIGTANIIGNNVKFRLDESGNLTTSGTITSSAGELGVGDITGVTLTGDSGGALADTAGSADFTVAGGTNCTTAGSGSTITVNIDDAFIVNNAADVMTVSDFGANAAFKIDADQPDTTGAENSIGLHIDYDRAVATSGTAAHNDIGIDLDINSASLGISSVKGMDIDVIGATSGVHTAVGLDINVSGADINQGLNINVPDGADDYHIKLTAADDWTNDYATFKVADTGDLTIETVGNGTNDSNLTLNADGDVLLDANTGVTKFQLAGDADDLCTLTVAANGETTVATTDSDGQAGHLNLDINGGLYIDVDTGEARISSGGSTYTPSHSTSIVTKAYVDSFKHTAVWGGELARVAGSGTWLGIPTGHSLGALQMGTGSDPDTSYSPSTTADDLVACIWASMHDITVKGCKIWVAQGGTNNTGHNYCLMRYDIDVDGDLSNGVVVASTSTINSDDHSHARAATLSLSGTAANLDVDFSSNQILIALIEPTIAYNSYMAAKVILEYTEVMT